MKPPLNLPFPRDLGYPVIRKWFIDDGGSVLLAEVGVSDAEMAKKERWRIDEVIVLNPATGRLETHYEGDRVFDGREEALCGAILRALDKLEDPNDPDAAAAREIVRIYRGATSNRYGRPVPIPSDCLDCRGTALLSSCDPDVAWRHRNEGQYCPVCRGTGVTIQRRDGETVEEAQRRIERAFPGTAARLGW